MNRCVLSVSRYLIPGFVTACLATGSLAQQGPPNGLNVNVLNTPLPITGSTTVSGTVNVGNTVGVNVLNTPLAVTGSVTTSGSVSLAPGSTVTINSTNPVRVKSVNDGIQPVQAAGHCNTNSVGCGSGFVYTVPANKRLVIEYVSLQACGLPGLTATWTILLTNVGSPGNVEHGLNVTPPAMGPGNPAIGCNGATPSSATSVGQVVRLYAETGSIVTFDADRGNGIGGNAVFTFSFSGYLVDVP